MLKLLDLFSGIGGFSLAASWTGKIETMAFCEIDDYCGKVLNKNFPGIPVHKDIKTLKNKGQYGTIDIITGGFPCQPFSVAGKQKGKGDDRYLWPEMLRVIQEFKPTWVLGENVTGIINLGLETVFSDLEKEGYEVQPIIIPACAKDAKHQRSRVWILAYSERNQYREKKRRVNAKEVCLSRENREKRGWSRQFSRTSYLVRTRKTNWIYDKKDVAYPQGKQSDGLCGKTNKKLHRWNPRMVIKRGRNRQPIPTASQTLANSNNPGNRTQKYNYNEEWKKEEQRRKDKSQYEFSGYSEEERGDWAPEPPVGRVANGIPSRVDRLKGLGNAIVPQVAYEILKNLN